jgi:sugar phosphate isomerase/epimerase
LTTRTALVPAAAAALALASATPGLAEARPPAGTFVPVLHSVSYAGVWRGQAQLDTDAFLRKAKELADLGTTCVRVFTGYERPGVPPDVQWGVVVAGLKLAAKRAAEHGVTLAVQNHHDIAVHPAALLWLLQEVNEPNVRAAFDAWSPALAGVNGEELAAAARKLAPHMVYTTVADYVKHPRLRYDATVTNYVRGDDLVRAVPFGKGFIDYRAFFRGLREGGYSGYVAYEMCEVLEGGGSIENLDRTARHFLQVFREMTR